MKEKKLATIAVRTGIESDTQHNAVVPPIYLSSNYSFPEFGSVPQYDYSRSGNPTRTLLAQTLADLEQGDGAVVTNCGMSAVNLAASLLSVGDLIIAPHDCYGGTYRLFDVRARKGDFKVLFIDQSDEEAWQQALAQNPKMIWLETPSNPLLRVVDIADICQKAKQLTDCRVVVDNTFLSPLLQQPLTLGADLVVHSTTKYINGHSDVVGGVVVSKTPEDTEQLIFMGNCIGATSSPFDSYLTLRGIRTLAVRMRGHEENAAKVLTLLDQHALVEKVYHPSIVTHPGHEIAKKQQTGFGSMISFELNGSETQLKTFISELKLFSLAESLGGVESLIAHPRTMTHRAMSDEAQEEAGLSPMLLRLSVGLEDGDDLVADLTQALNKAIQ